MIAHHADGNLILQQIFKTRSDKHRIAVYNAIMTRLAARGLAVDLQILDNEASAAYKHTITVTWQVKFQLVPPDMHHHNRVQSAHSRITSLPSWLALTQPFPRTFGTFSSHRQNSRSTFSDSRQSILGYLLGNSSKAHLTSTRPR